MSIILHLNISSLVSISSMYIVVVQSITLESESNASRACGPTSLLEGVDDIELTVQIDSPEAPDRSHILFDNTTYFRQISQDGRVRKLCVPSMLNCSLGVAQLRQVTCACVGIRGNTFIVVFKQVASERLSESIIDFVWMGSSMRSQITSATNYSVPLVVSACTAGLKIPKKWQRPLLITGFVIKICLSSIGLCAFLYCFKKDMCFVRTRCRKCCFPCCWIFKKCCLCLPCCKIFAGDSDSGSSGSDSDDSGSSSLPGGLGAPVVAAPVAPSEGASPGTGQEGQATPADATA